MALLENKNCYLGNIGIIITIFNGCTVGRMDNLVEMNELCFERNGRAIFSNVNLTIPRGQVTAVMGPSGTGKTTLLRLIGGELRPSRGNVVVAGQSVPKLRRKALFQLRRRMGMLFQNSGLFTHLNVFENVAFPLREHTRLSNAMIRSLVLMKLEMVGLRGAHELMPSELSGGMSRRVALARAIALDPELIMYDEPLSGQDPISMGVLIKLIRTVNDALGITTIIVSHDVQETLSIADYTYVIADSKIIGEGTPRSIQANQSEQVQQFLQGLPDGPVPFHYPSRSLQQDLLGEKGA